MARRSRIRLHVSPALVVAAIALAVSLGGTGYAAMKLPKNSVGAPQLKKNAVNSAKVKDASLLAVDFATGQLPAGPPGSKGDKGDQGAPGPAGAQGPPGLSDLQYVEVVGATNLTNPREVQAICPAGKRVVGGGHALSNNAKSAGTIAESRPLFNLLGWVATARWPSSVFPQNWTLLAYAVCARVGT